MPHFSPHFVIITIMNYLKYTVEQIGGQYVKSNETYDVIDNKMLNNLVLSQTVLHAGKETSGHVHPGQEEIYFFVFGHGTMVVAKSKDNIHPTEVLKVRTGDIVLVPDGYFHKVYNGGDTDLIFNCVFDGNRNH